MIDKVNSRRVNIIEVNEQWSTAKLEDGSIIKIKMVFLGAHLILNDDNTVKFNDDGSPQYAINSQQILVIEAFESVPENTTRN